MSGLQPDKEVPLITKSQLDDLRSSAVAKSNPNFSVYVAENYIDAADRRDLEKKIDLAREKRKKAIAAAIAERNIKQRAESAGRYIRKIKLVVERNWDKPKDVWMIRPCTVEFSQLFGLITNIEFKDCQSDSKLRASINSALQKASPLPRPEDVSLYDEKVSMTFR